MLSQAHCVHSVLPDVTAAPAPAEASSQATAIVCQGSSANVSASASAAASIFFNSTGVQACLVSAPLTPVTPLTNGGARE